VFQAIKTKIVLLPQRMTWREVLLTIPVGAEGLVKQNRMETARRNLRRKEI